MNERIKELAEQAYQLADAETRGQYEKWHTDKTLPLPTPFNEAYEQKFAELIVRECMYVGRLAQINNQLVDSEIKEHFGVEE